MTDTAIAGTSTPAGLDTLTPDARARVGSALADARSPNTRRTRTYRAQWQRFAAWCERHGRAGLPASPATVADYLTNRATAAKTATVRLSGAAIGAAHRAAGQPDPTATPIVRDSMRGIARQHAAHPDAAPRQAAALTYDDAIRLMATAERPQPAGRGVESAEHAAERARLDAAIVALLFCAGLRRSEVSALRWADVEPTAVAGQVRVRVRTSKTNPTADREDYRLTVNGFAAALDALRSATDPQPTDRVVPLSPRQVCRRVQALATRAGLDGVSAHSGRRGMATELVRRGASTTAIQQAGGWKDPQMVARYASAVSVEGWRSRALLRVAARSKENRSSWQSSVLFLCCSLSACFCGPWLGSFGLSWHGYLIGQVRLACGSFRSFSWASAGH